MKRSIFNNIIILLIVLLILFAIYIVEPFRIATPEGKIEGGEVYWAIKYVTPSDSDVKQQTYNILGSRYNSVVTDTDVRELQRWVAEEIEYKMELPEYPKETLEDRTGTCFNMCNLLLSMIYNENYKSASYMLLLEVKTEGDNEVFKHSAVLTIFEDDQVIISDPTVGAEVIDIVCSLNSPKEAVETIIEGTNVEWYTITHAISLDSTDEFKDNWEFYDWVEGHI